MSYSSLYLIDHKTALHETIDFGNSWLFSPVTWEIITHSYALDEIKTDYRIARSLIHGPDSDSLYKILNRRINESPCMADRVLWELSNQQMFFAKDKDLVADSIIEFYENHKNDTLLYNNDNNLSLEHIKSRWFGLADAIRNINVDEVKYFIHKNTSVDDTVELLFDSPYDEDDYDEGCVPLYTLNDLIKSEKGGKDYAYFEIVHINDGKMTFTPSREHGLIL